MKEKKRQLKEKAESLREQVADVTQRAMDLAQEKGASNGLSALPLQTHGFNLLKSLFRDTLCLHYG